MSRFDYVKYDENSQTKSNLLKSIFVSVEKYIDLELPNSRAKSLAITALEECYMWVGKAIRDDQIARNGSAELQEERVNS